MIPYKGFPLGMMRILSIQTFLLLLCGAVKASPELQTDKRVYVPGEQITVHFRNAPGNRNDWITIVQKGARDGQFRQYKWLKATEAGSLIFRGVKEGVYEARMHLKGTHAEPAARYAFSVGKARVADAALNQARANDPGQPKTFAECPNRSVSSKRARMPANTYRRIRDLTAAIDAGTLKSEELHKALTERGFIYAISGNVGLAQRDLDSAVKLNPCNANTYFAMGLADFRGRRGMAREAFGKALQIDPAFVDAYRARAWAWLLAENTGSATKDFNALLELVPNDKDAQRGKGWASLQAGRYDEAVLAFDAFSRTTSGNPEGALGKGLAQFFAGRHAEARSEFLASLRKRHNPSTAISYGNVELDDWRRFRRVLDALNKRLRQNPQQHDAWLAMAAVNHRDPSNRRRVGNLTAIKSLNQALAIQPDDVDVLISRAVLYSDNRSYKRKSAINDLNRAISLDPEAAEAYFRRALLVALNPETLPAAIEDCTRALELTDDHPTVATVLENLKAKHAQWQRRKKSEAAVRQAQREADEFAAAAVLMGALAIAIGSQQQPGPDDKWMELHNKFIEDWGNDILMNNP